MRPKMRTPRLAASAVALSVIPAVTPALHAQLDGSGQIVVPETVVIRHGAYLRGELEDVWFADDAYLEIGEIANFVPDGPMIQVEVLGIVETIPTERLSFILETSSDAQPFPVPQRLELFNFDLNAWVIVDERLVHDFDELFEVAIEAEDDPASFVDRITGAVRSRIGHFNPGEVFQTAWKARVDIALWTTDLTEFLTGACCKRENGGTCDVESVLACLAAGGTWGGPRTTCADGDRDRIADVFERNDCTLRTRACIAPTDPAKADTDGDAINDGDEFFGTTGGLDLPKLGAKPCRRDIFLEIDWTHDRRNKPHLMQITRVVRAFKDSSIRNPDRSEGISLHVDYGQGDPFTEGNYAADTWGDRGILNVTNDSLDGSDFGRFKQANFDRNRNGFFHYCVIADKYSVGGTYKNSTGLAELPGDDLIVSTGQWWRGNEDRIGNTVMHEFGHNLNLRHGGDEHRNYKPNYNSVMNYWYQFCGTDNDHDAMPDGDLDYSTGGNIDLDERALKEAEGVRGARGPAIDWDLNRRIDRAAVRTNLNCELQNDFSDCPNVARQISTCGSNNAAGCPNAWSACAVIKDYDDWSNLRYNGIGDGDFVEIIHCTLDEGMTFGFDDRAIEVLPALGEALPAFAEMEIRLYYEQWHGSGSWLETDR